MRGVGGIEESEKMRKKKPYFQTEKSWELE